MKKVFISFLFITFFLLVGCTKEKSFNCKIDIYNEVDEYKLIANYKIYYKNTEVLKIDKEEKYISDNEKTLEYFNEYKKLEYENLNNLYGEVLYNISDSENEVIIKSTIDMANLDIKKMRKDKYIDRDYIINDKLTTGGIKDLYENRGAICEDY